MVAKPVPALTEKVILLYEQMFQDENFDKSNAHYWDEFFLLRPNVGCLSDILTRHLLNLNERARKAKIVQGLVRRSVTVVKYNDAIRCANGLQTLNTIIACCSRFEFCHHNSNKLIELLFGADNTEIIMNEFLERCCAVLADVEANNCLIQLTLHLLLTIATAFDDLNTNILLEYFLTNSLFEVLVQHLGFPLRRKLHGSDVLLLLTLLINYRKYENVNPYIVKLSILDDELILNGYSHTIAARLCKINQKFKRDLNESEPSGILSSISTVVGSIFATDGAANMSVEVDLSVLLALYEAIHLNRNFITTLITVPTEEVKSLREIETLNEDSLTTTSNDKEEATLNNGDTDSLSSSPQDCSNLLAAFLTYTSIVFGHLKGEKNKNAARLCSIILTCITEDQYANTLMHDINLMFKVPVYRIPTRHRKCKMIDEKGLTGKPLACAVLDICTEFTAAHMMTNLPAELYRRIFGIIQRILCYEKKMRLRLEYQWSHLWNALTSFLKFIVTSESALAEHCDIFPLIQKVLTLINLFITYGDTFLPNPASYDRLYYELIRNTDNFNNLYSMLLRHTTTENRRRDIAVRLCNSMVNIKSIVNHFQQKITETLETTSITEDDILNIVRSNYDSLILKLQENLDVYEPYNEKPLETAFFAQMVRVILTEDARRHTKVVKFDYDMFLKTT